MTTLTASQPISKLYKRCARNHHDQCPGSFETWSVCTCACHAGVSDMRVAATMPRPAPETPVTPLNTCEVVAEAVAIVGTTEIVRDDGSSFTMTCTPVVTQGERKATPKTKGSGLSTKTDKYAKWANAIVAKNTRIRLAWEEHQAKYGLYLQPGQGFTSTLAPMQGDHHCVRLMGEYCPRCAHETEADYRKKLTGR